MEMQEFFTSCVGICEPGLTEILSQNALLRHLEKRDILIEQGEIPSYIYLLKEGVIRGFVPRYHGEDLTETFIYIPGDLIWWNEESRPGRVSGRASSDMIYQSLTPCEIITLPAPLIHQLLLENLELNHLMRKYMMERINFHMENKYIRSHSSPDRYRWFHERFPELTDGRVQDQHIASFLDITPATYSRLKKDK